MQETSDYIQMAVQLLESIAPLPEGLKTFLQKRFSVRSFAAKEYLLHAGDNSDRLSFIASGLVRIFSDTPSKLGSNEKEVCNWFLMEGDIVISVESFFEQKISQEYIQALEPSVTVSLSREDLEDVYKRFPTFNYHGRILTQHYYVQAIRQLKAIRYKRADDSYKYLQEQFPKLLRRVPSRYLASYLSVNETYLSTLRNRARIQN